METFDQKGGLNDKLGRHKISEMPEGLSWEQMGPKIRAELKQKKRRRLLFWWWLPVGLSVVLTIAYFSLFGSRTELGHFPVPGLSAGQHSATAKTATEMLEEKPAARALKGTVPTPDAHKAKGSTNVSLAPRPSPMADKTAAPTAPINDPKDSQAIISRKAQNNKAGVAPLNQIGLLPPKTIGSIDPNTPYPEVRKLQPASRPWIVEAGMGLAFNLNPDVYGTKLPNTAIDPLTGLAASLRIGYVFPQRPYTLWAGVEMGELVQRERLQEAFPIQLYQPNTVDTIFRNTITGETFTTTTDSIPGIRRVNIQQHSTFRSWSMPVLLGRAWPLAGWQLEGKAGADLNLSSWATGRYLGEGYTLANASNRFQMGWAVRLEGQLLSPKTRFGRIWLRAGYRREIAQQPGLTDEGTFRPQSLSLSLGWRRSWQTAPERAGSAHSFQ